jgi:hypothetical protein
VEEEGTARKTTGSTSPTLSLPSSSKKGKERAKLPSQDAQFHQAGGKKKNSSYIPGMPESEDDEGDVSDADLIVEMMEKRNVKDGKAVVKSAVAKKGDNGKGMKEATGGGSFPTMGSFLVLLTRFRVYLVLFRIFMADFCSLRV